MFFNFFFFFLLFPCLFAGSSSSNHSSTHHPSSPPHNVAPHTQSLTKTVSHTFPIVTRVSHVSQPHRPPHTIPIPTKEPDPAHIDHHDRRHTQKPIIIFFEALGGVAGTAFLLGLLRCFYIYRRTPERDRIEAILSRHHLQRELEELERNPVSLRRRPILEPAPPYFPPPPSYDGHGRTSTASDRRADYVEVETSSPPISPPPHVIPLASSHTPPMPNG